MQLFHYRQDGQDKGPFSLDQILSMWQRGMIRPQDEIRSHGASIWHPAEAWIRHADSKQAQPYNLILQEQAPVDIVAKVKSYPNKFLAIVVVLAALGLVYVHWSWTLGLGVLFLILMRPAYQCSTCHNDVSSSADWCSRCGSHLKH